MSLQIRRIILRFLAFILLQVLVLKQINLGGAEFNYFSILIYPVTILLLPIHINKTFLLLISFLVGITVDLFYNSPGVHAGALVFMAFLRPYVLKYLEPSSHYGSTDMPYATKFGLLWYMRYIGILLFIFLFTYFSIEIFTFFYFKTILLKTIFSFIISFGFLLIHQMLFNPK